MKCLNTVIPAKAGVHRPYHERIGDVANEFAHWIPAFAGMTEVKVSNCVSPIRIEIIRRQRRTQSGTSCKSGKSCF